MVSSNWTAPAPVFWPMNLDDNVQFTTVAMKSHATSINRIWTGNDSARLIVHNLTLAKAGNVNPSLSVSADNGHADIVIAGTSSSGPPQSRVPEPITLTWLAAIGLIIRRSHNHQQ